MKNDGERKVIGEEKSNGEAEEEVEPNETPYVVGVAREHLRVGIGILDEVGADVGIVQKAEHSMLEPAHFEMGRPLSQLH